MEALQVPIQYIYIFFLIISALIFIPQGIKIYHNKSTNDLSVITFFGLFLVQFIIILYGIISHDWILTVICILGIITYGYIIVSIVNAKKNTALHKVTLSKSDLLDRLNMLENIIAIMPGHVYWVDKNNVYLGCNDNQAKSAGLSSRQDIVGKKNRDLPWNYNDAHLSNELDRINMEVMRSAKPASLEEPGTLINGEKVVYLSSKTPLFSESGNLIGMVGISVDVTELKHTQDKLKQAEERLSGMIALSSSIAHELRTPLTAIENGVSGIKDYLPILMDGYLKAKAHDLPVTFIRPHHYEILVTVLDDVESETHYANTIIDMILMNVKQHQDSQANFQTVTISTCIDEAIRRYPFKSKEAELIKWDYSIDFSFKGNKVFIVHILFNLIKNALYFIEAENKGEILIECEVTNNRNLLYFKDTAKGILPDIMPRLFEKFYSTTLNGTGLGLAFCKMVMEGLGGNIDCESEYGKFTKFTLSFPKIMDGGNEQ